MLTRKNLAVLSMVVMFGVLPNSLSWAHDDHRHNESEGISVPDDRELTPWTHLKFNNNPNAFQFAIVTDRTGGNRPGVFSQAVAKLNLLQPEFVVSVGDLIEGYTEDSAQINNEWDALDTLVQSLDMPFFYLAGNHDYTNAVMADIWRKRYGPSYYHFTYRDTLFVMLNSNDGGETHTMSQVQIDWLAQVLKDNPDPRWTLVFTHSPLWDRDDSDRWDQVDALLKDRKYTVFAGHHHRYVKQQRVGREYFTLATAGGASSLRGPRFGEFDHVVWITMSDEGPIVANLMLDGIWDSDVRTAEMRGHQNAMIERGRVRAPALLYRESFTEGEARLRLINDADIPYQFTAQLKQLGSVNIEGERQPTVTVPPNEVRELPIRLSSSTPVSDDRDVVEADWTLSYELHGETIEYQDSINIPLVLERPIPRLENLTLDGTLDDWPDDIFFDNRENFYFNTENRKGDADASFRWAMATVGQRLLIAVDVKDDDLVRHGGEGFGGQDMVILQLDARPKLRRLMKYTYNSRVEGERSMVLLPETAEHLARFQAWPELPDTVQYQLVSTDTGYSAELAIPFDLLNEDSGGAWDGIKFNVMLRDVDRGEPGVLGTEWRTSWNHPASVGGEGSFYRE